jgi:hypothetical protein
MGKKRRVLPILGGVAGFFLILGLFGLTQGNPPNDAQLRADVIRIDVTAGVMGDPVERRCAGHG